LASRGGRPLALAELDRDAFLWVVEHRAGWLDPIFVAATVVGYAGLVWIALAPPLAAWAKRPLLVTSALTAVCVWTSDIVATGAKSLIGRPRPFERLGEADPLFGSTVGSSFPSGHAATAAAGVIALAVLTRKAVPALVALALLVSFSRVYVGVHYPLDVLGGAALGAAVTAGLLLALRPPLRLSGVPPRSRAAPPPD
jgi:undecaprenyl-diphosphatase